jgi:hypothetical protein
MSYEQPPSVIYVPQEEGANIFAWVIGILIVVIIIMAIVWALAYQRNVSSSDAEDDAEEDEEGDAGASTGKYVKCPTKISNTQKTQCEWSKLDARNTRCLASKSKKCTEDTAKEECSILGKWMDTDQGKYVCNFKSTKELVFNDAVEEPEEPEVPEVLETSDNKPPETKPDLPASTCSIFGHCNENEYASKLSCKSGGNTLYCARGYCPAGIFNDGGCWTISPQ